MLKAFILYYHMDSINYITDLLSRYNLSNFNWLVDLLILGITISLFVRYVVLPIYNQIYIPGSNIITKISNSCDQVDSLSNTIMEIKNELKTNGGSTIKDIVIKLQKDVHSALSNHTHGISRNRVIFKFLGFSHDHNGLGIYETDNMGKCTYVTSRYCEITGLTESQALQHGWIESIHPDDRSKVHQEFMESVQEGRLFNMTFRIRNVLTNNIYTVLGNAFPIVNNTEICGYIGSISIKQHENYTKPNSELP
jgi:PAS domain S-box-containing protein